MLMLKLKTKRMRGRVCPETVFRDRPSTCKRVRDVESKTTKQEKTKEKDKGEGRTIHLHGNIR